MLLWNLIGLPFKSKSRLVAENAVLSQQVMVLQRKVRGRLDFTHSDCLFFVQLYRMKPTTLMLNGSVMAEIIQRGKRAGALMRAIEPRGPIHSRST